MVKKFAAILIIAAWLAYALPNPNPAQTADGKVFTVNSLADTVDANPGNGKCADAGGNCTLRAAVMESNTFVGPVSIHLPDEIIPLSLVGAGEDSAQTGDLDLKSNQTIQGAGADKSIIDAQSLGEGIFDILPGANITINDVTIRNGSDTGISNFGTLLIKGSKVEHNSTQGAGGGISNYHKLTVESSEINDNSARLSGGGIDNNDADLILNKTAVYNNISLYTGGGISLNSNSLFGNIIITDSSINHNSSILGGGIYISDVNATLAKSTVNDNISDSYGGGIFINGNMFPPEVYITNSTISQNSACNSGGGIYDSDGSLKLNNSTIANNKANYGMNYDKCTNYGTNPTGTGGGILSTTVENVDITNTILAHNYRVIPSHLFTTDDCQGTLGTLKYSLLETSTGCTFTNNNSITGKDPKLELLAENGGPTMTQALQEDSPALDAGDPNGCKDQDGDLLTTDQRGYARPFDGDGNGSARCDIGAYELVKFSSASYLPFVKR